jgi:elongation factor G
MKVFDSENIRNIAVVGHGDSGKTSLVSALLYVAGATNRLGRIEEGNTVTDYDEDEIQRRITINTALGRCEWRNTKINLLDTPGYRAFILDAKAAAVAAESALVVVDAVAGVEVQTEEVWSYAEELKLPRVVVINKLDRERASFSRSLQSLNEVFGRAVVPVALPIGEEKEFSGIVDLTRNRAYLYEADGSGKFKEQDIPANLKDQAEEARAQLIEMVAESDDELMEKFFENGTLTDSELSSGLNNSIRSRSLFPAVCVSATSLIGITRLLDWMVDVFPNPLQREPFEGLQAISRAAVQLPIAKDGSPVAFVFKTLADPYAGRISMIKVVSGVLKGDSTVRNLNQDKDERVGPIQIPQGKTNESVPEARTGDVCAVLKLRETTTGDTLAERGHPHLVKKVEFPEPAISFAILPKSRGDEDKIGTAIARIIEEDPSIRFSRDAQTKEFLLSGSGQLHVEVVVAKLQKKFGVEVILKPPKVPYRETITGKAEVQGRHKKQTGGHGQFGDCWIRMEPLERGQGFEFANEIFGGSIPRQFVPAVEKGIIESADRGFLAGFPVVDFKVTLFDGSYHDVDSSEMSFKIAGSLAFKKGMEEARAVLLEPIMNVEVYVPEENAGDIMGDLNSRRGRIQGMDRKGNNQVVKAQVPLAEMLSYAPVLTSLTGGRGSYRMEKSHYDVVPAHMAEKVIAEAKKEKEES